jgi:hypothetical protein
MSSSVVRIGVEARNTLREIAARTGRPMQSILDEAIERFRRQRFLEEVNAAYAFLARDPAASEAVRKEREAWEATLADGLDPGERWAPDGTAVAPSCAVAGRKAPGRRRHG